MNKRTISVIVLALAIVGVIIFALYKVNPFGSSDYTQGKKMSPTEARSTYELPFANKTIQLIRANSGSTESTFWNTTIASVSVNGTLDSLYDREDWGVSLFYDSPKNAFYYLNPGGYEKISIVTSSYIAELAKPKNQKLAQEDLTGTTTYRSCAQKETSVGSITGVLSVPCTERVVSDEFSDVLDESTVVACFIPISSGNYLAFELPLRPVGTSLNLCESLTAMGIQSITEITKK